MTKPGVQKPHCEAWVSTIACCTGCSVPSGPASDSTVTTWQPSSEPTKRMQALTDLIFQPAVEQAADQHGAGAAIALGASFLGAAQIAVEPQEIEKRF